MCDVAMYACFCVEFQRSSGAFDLRLVDICICGSYTNKMPLNFPANALLPLNYFFIQMWH